MGAPGYVAFCGNGHMVKAVPHHCIDDTEITECTFCDAKEFVILTEWPDEDYYPDGKTIVPEEPIRQEWIEVNNNHIKGKVNVDVFDVSKVPASWWRNRVF
jgi:hypothetical protein